MDAYSYVLSVRKLTGLIDTSKILVKIIFLNRISKFKNKISRFLISDFQISVSTVFYKIINLYYVYIKFILQIIENFIWFPHLRFN